MASYQEGHKKKQITVWGYPGTGLGLVPPGLTAGQLLAGSKSLRPWNQGFLAVPVVTGEALKGSKAEPQVLLLAMTLM